MRRLYLSILFIFFVAGNCFAGWPVGKGRSVIGVGYNLYYGTKSFDDSWHLKDPKDPSDFFRSNYFSVYLAHGISRRLDLVANASYQYQQARQAGVIKERNDFGDAMAGLAYSVENNDFTKYVTFQLSGIFPLYTNPDNKLQMGYGSRGIDFSINYSINPKYLKNDGYLMYQLGYRKYFDGDGPQQLIGDATIAFIIKRFHQLLFNIEGVSSFSTNTSTSINPKEVYNYDTFKFTATYGRKVRRTIVLYGSAFYTFIGRNSLQGMGLGANMIIKLP